MSCKTGAMIVVASALLAGCETVGENRSTDPGFGEAARYNAAIQTINPDPVVVAGADEPGDSGAVGAAALKRYRTDAVKQPVAQSTQGGAGGGSGGGQGPR